VTTQPSRTVLKPGHPLEFAYILHTYRRLVSVNCHSGLHYMPKRSSGIRRGKSTPQRRAHATKAESAAGPAGEPHAQTTSKAGPSGRQRTPWPPQRPALPGRELRRTSGTRFTADKRRGFRTLAKSRAMSVLRWPRDHLRRFSAAVAGVVIVVAIALAWMIIHQVSVDVVTAQPTGGHDFSVPAAAVQNQGGSDVVFVVVHGTAYRQPVLAVTKGATDTITSGLSQGAMVVVHSGSAITDGQAVHVSNG
jgi:hypothetical protein